MASGGLGANGAPNPSGRQVRESAASLLADLSAMLQGPASVDGTLRVGDPSAGSDDVLPMMPLATPPAASAQRAQALGTAGKAPFGLGGSSPAGLVGAAPAAIPAAASPAPGAAAGEGGNARGTEALVAYALRSLTQDVTQKMQAFQATLTKMEGRLEGLGTQVEQSSMAVGSLNSSIEQKLTAVESTLRDVVRSVQLLKDKQELFDAQQELVKVTTEATEARKRAESISEDSPTADKPGKAAEPAAEERRRSVGQVQEADAPAAPVVSQPPAQPPTASAAPPPTQGLVPPQAVQQFPPAPAVVPAVPYAPAPYGQPPQYSPPVGMGGYGGPPMPPRGAPPHSHPPPPQGYASQPPMHPPLPAPVFPPPPPLAAPKLPPQPSYGRPQGPPPSGPSSGGGGGNSSSRVPIEKVVDDVAAMGFSKEQVRSVVRRLTESGKSVDLNIVLDQLMNGPSPERHPQQPSWYSR